MGRKMRLELTTSGTTNQRSNQLSYIRQKELSSFTGFFPFCQASFYRFVESCSLSLTQSGHMFEFLLSVTADLIAGKRGQLL